MFLCRNRNFNQTHLTVEYSEKLKSGVLYGPANDPSTANDPQIGPQMIPKPEMIPANGDAKNREWSELQEWSMHVYSL